MQHIRYVDQNNNVYDLRGRRFSYRAVKPEESSSGVYDGGEDQEMVISEELLANLWEQAMELADATETHSARREMMTAILTISTDEDRSRFILKRSSLREKWEEGLRALLEAT